MSSAYLPFSTFYSHTPYPDRCFSRSSEKFALRDDSSDIFSLSKLPAAFVSFVSKLVAKESFKCIEHNIEHDNRGFDAFHSKTMQILACFGMFPLTYDNIRREDLMSHSVVMEKMLGITQHETGTFYGDLVHKILAGRGQTAIVVFNSKLDNIPLFAVFGDEKYVENAVVVMVYSDNLAVGFAPEQFKFYTRKIKNAVVEPRSEENDVWPVVTYEMCDGLWVPRVNTANVLQMMANILDTPVRLDALTVDFAKMMESGRKEKKMSVTGYIGRSETVLGIVMNDKQDREKYISDFFEENRSPCLFFRKRNDVSVLFLYIPNRPVPRDKVTPCIPYFYDCSVHAYHFMRSCCSHVECIVDPTPRVSLMRTRATKFLVDSTPMSRIDSSRFFGSNETACVMHKKKEDTSSKHTFDSIVQFFAWLMDRKDMYTIKVDNEKKIRFHRRLTGIMSYDISGEILAYVRHIFCDITRSTNDDNKVAKIVELHAYENGSIRIVTDGCDNWDHYRYEFYQPSSQCDVAEVVYMKRIATLSRIPWNLDVYNAWVVPSGILILMRKPESDRMTLHKLDKYFEDCAIPEYIWSFRAGVTWKMPETPLTYSSYCVQSRTMVCALVLDVDNSQKMVGGDNDVIVSVVFDQLLSKGVRTTTRGVFRGFLPILPPFSGTRQRFFGGLTLNEDGNTGIMMFGIQPSEGSYSEYMVFFNPVELSPIKCVLIEWHQESPVHKRCFKSGLFRSFPLFARGSVIDIAFPVPCRLYILRLSCDSNCIISAITFPERKVLPYVKLFPDDPLSDPTKICFIWSYNGNQLPFRNEKGGTWMDVRTGNAFTGSILWSYPCFTEGQEQTISDLIIRSEEMYGLFEIMTQCAPEFWAPRELRQVTLRLPHPNSKKIYNDERVTSFVEALERKSCHTSTFEVLLGEAEAKKVCDSDYLLSLVMKLCGLPTVVVSGALVDVTTQSYIDGSLRRRYLEFPVFPFLRMTPNMPCCVISAVGQRCSSVLSCLVGTEFMANGAGTLAVGYSTIPIFNSPDFVDKTTFQVKADTVHKLKNVIGALYTVEHGKYSEAVAFILAVATSDAVVVSIDGGKNAFIEFFKMVMECVDVLCDDNNISLSREVHVTVIYSAGVSMEHEIQHVSDEMMALAAEFIRQSGSARRLIDVCKFCFVQQHDSQLLMAREILMNSMCIDISRYNRETSDALSLVHKGAVVYGSQIDFEFSSKGKDGGVSICDRPDAAVDGAEKSFALSERYRQGKHVRVDKDRAKELCMEASRLGHAEALYAQAMYYSPSNEVLGLLNAAAELGSSNAKLEMYRQGPEDTKMKWLREASDNGNLDAQETEAQLADLPVDRVKVVKRMCIDNIKRFMGDSKQMGWWFDLWFTVGGCECLDMFVIVVDGMATVAESSSTEQREMEKCMNKAILTKLRNNMGDVVRLCVPLVKTYLNAGLEYSLDDIKCVRYLPNSVLLSIGDSYMKSRNYCQKCTWCYHELIERKELGFFTKFWNDCDDVDRQKEIRNRVEEEIMSMGKLHKKFQPVCLFLGRLYKGESSADKTALKKAFDFYFRGLQLKCSMSNTYNDCKVANCFVNSVGDQKWDGVCDDWYRLAKYWPPTNKDSFNISRDVAYDLLSKCALERREWKIAFEDFKARWVSEDAVLVQAWGLIDGTNRNESAPVLVKALEEAAKTDNVAKFTLAVVKANGLLGSNVDRTLAAEYWRKMPVSMTKIVRTFRGLRLYKTPKYAFFQTIMNESDDRCERARARAKLVRSLSPRRTTSAIYDDAMAVLLYKLVHYDENANRVIESDGKTDKMRSGIERIDKKYVVLTGKRKN